MKVGIIGSGGREHAICEVLKKSRKITKIYCFPGNAGTENISQNVNLDLENFKKLKNFILENKIGLIIVGPEKPLVDGLVDYLQKFKIKVFGPNKKASRLEGSKIFTKKLCKKYNIPTAKFGIFQNKKNAKKFLKNSKYPIVIKADNLASGKGVYICKNKIDANHAIEEIFNGKFGKAKNLLIEEFLNGEEMSFFTIHDGKNYKFFGTAQDHKRVFEGDRGKNTGGMGAYSPSRLINNKLQKKIVNKIIKPTLAGLSNQNTKYLGFLYTGLMIVNDEPFLIEFNVRMGDPECQTIIPKLKTDLYEIFLACCEERLNKLNVKWYNKKSLCIVLCSKGYPEGFKKNVEIKNLNKIITNQDKLLFHAGTIKKNKKIYAIGGRVLNFISLSKNFSSARKNIITAIHKLNWPGGFFRRDIGYKVIKK
ncbi:phosphoribosylamine--glycine ligase [Candidatus Pelagibacter sp. FZCC0015]|uniref:phosphoribosylamine--glycine ligase n=1 Tax=Candidatus Pelagibacter sp. FZCC0015 TaxID=2268451 RepID=UPI0011A836DB|nr:phosphoribosylamine--glycine ligase [Candidatus Pelagibacter sp. FZCC0015]